MRIFFFIVFLSILPNFSITQNYFEKIIGDEKVERINAIIECDDNSIILVGALSQDISSPKKAYLIKLDSSGNILSQIIFEEENIETSICNIYQINSNYYIFGLYSTTDKKTGGITVSKTDSSFKTIWQSKLHTIDNQRVNYLNSILDSDSNFVITGYTVPNNSSVNSFFYKVSMGGDSLCSNFEASEEEYSLSFDIIENHDSSKYYAFVNFFTYIFFPPAHGQIVTLDKQFNVLGIDSVPHRMQKVYSPLWINDTTILISAKSYHNQHNTFDALTLSSTFTPIQHKTYYQNYSDEFPAFTNCTSKSKVSSHIYLGSTTNFDNLGGYYSNNDSWFHLVKVDEEINTVWEKWYGGNAYYVLHSIQSSSQGGCILVGTRYDNETQDMETDIYLIKVDGDGLITWEKEIPIPQSIAQVYPNPGRNKLRVQTQLKDALFRLTTLEGKTIVEKQITQKTSILNTQTLIPGVYFWTLSKDDKIVESGKWVKE